MPWGKVVLALLAIHAVTACGPAEYQAPPALADGEETSAPKSEGGNVPPVQPGNLPSGDPTPADPGPSTPELPITDVPPEPDLSESPPPATPPAPGPNPGPEQPVPTTYCHQNAGGEFSEKTRISHGRGRDFDWAQGGGCVLRPIHEVWAVLHNLPLLQWEGVTSSRHTLSSSPPTGVRFLYEVSYQVKATVTVDWVMQWKHLIKLGDPESPRRIVIEYQKTKGTSYIRHWKGMIILDRVTSQVTSVTMRDEINATQTNDEDSAGSVSDVIRKLQTGDPVWDPKI